MYLRSDVLLAVVTSCRKIYKTENPKFNCLLYPPPKKKILDEHAQSRFIYSII